MNARRGSLVFVFLTGVALGIGATHFSSASAAGESRSGDLGKKRFLVFVDEVKQNFVFGDQFAGHYSKTITLSNGKQRTIELTPVVHDGMQVVELKDTGFRSYMSLNGTTTNRELMVQIVDDDSRRRELREQGWKMP